MGYESGICPVASRANAERGPLRTRSFQCDVSMRTDPVLPGEAGVWGESNSCPAGARKERRFQIQASITWPEACTTVVEL